MVLSYATSYPKYFICYQVLISFLIQESSPLSLKFNIALHKDCTLQTFLKANIIVLLMSRVL